MLSFNLKRMLRISDLLLCKLPLASKMPLCVNKALVCQAAYIIVGYKRCISLLRRSLVCIGVKFVIFGTIHFLNPFSCIIRTSSSASKIRCKRKIDFDTAFLHTSSECPSDRFLNFNWPSFRYKLYKKLLNYTKRHTKTVMSPFRGSP